MKSKLSSDDRTRIRSLVAAGARQQEVADTFGVSQATISAVVKKGKNREATVVELLAAQTELLLALVMDEPVEKDQAERILALTEAVKQ